MVDTEIWLRLMSISSLYGDDMVRIAHWVAKQSHIDAVVLQQTGLTSVSYTHLTLPTKLEV
ncbi:hypothetical protein ELP57_35670, partial [Klebsiella pneumoniae]|nr:hypothetical protein [Klebsiella pneumoniae]